MTNECNIHAPVYQRSPIGEIHVQCPHCKDAEILLLKHESNGKQMEIDRLQRREREARAILEPLAEHDPAIREWLK